MSLTEADKPLMIAVERVVRPIRAMESRKDGMREELLGHLQQLAEREDDLAQVLQRLGEPDELRRQLQESVPALERLLFVPLFQAIPRWPLYQRRAGEGDGRFAWRVVVHNGITLALGITLPAIFLLLPGLRARPRDAWPGLVFVAAICVLFQLCSVIGVVLGFPMARALTARDYPRVAALGVLAFIGNTASLTLVVAVPVAWSIGPAAAEQALHAGCSWLLMVSVTLAAAYPLLAHLTQRETDRRTWTGLPISA